MQPYQHLTSEERSQIEVLRKQGLGPTAIGLRILRSKSTISREMRRMGMDLSYEAGLSHGAALKLRSKARRPTRCTPERLAEIEAGLRQGHSPQQIVEGGSRKAARRRSRD